jgi:hypothetical protein
LEGLAMEDAGIFYGHLVNIPTMWYILCLFGIFCVHLVYFLCFGILYHEKSLSFLEQVIASDFLRTKKLAVIKSGKITQTLSAQEPERPGYTLDELLILVRRFVQKTIQLSH